VSRQQTRANRFVGINYIDRDAKMAIPPEYWLQRLFDFDSELVVFPSLQTPFAYVLARKARRTGGMNMNDPAFEHATSDTKFCVARRMLPVSLIYRHNSNSWSIDNIIADLRSRDIWAAGGAEKVADRVDGEDANEEKRIKDEVRADFYNRSGDAWRSYQARTGQRTKTEYGHKHAKTGGVIRTA
jgi:hypothetical protein